MFIYERADNSEGELTNSDAGAIGPGNWDEEAVVSHPRTVSQFRSAYDEQTQSVLISLNYLLTLCHLSHYISRQRHELLVSHNLFIQ